MQDDLIATERRTFRAAVDTGIWDLLIAGVVAMFAIAPGLSVTMGDFWSAVVFVPVWAVLYLILWLVRTRLVVPRVGVVRFGADRQARLQTSGLVLAAVNVVALVVGLYAAATVDAGGGVVFPFTFFALVLVVFSLMAYATNIQRFFLYGLMLAGAPVVGEWLFREGYALHHGYPVVFGVATAVIAAVGLMKLALVFHRYPRRGTEPTPAGSDA